jgi:hypothetical protein
MFVGTRHHRYQGITNNLDRAVPLLVMIGNLKDAILYRVQLDMTWIQLHLVGAGFTSYL